MKNLKFRAIHKKTGVLTTWDEILSYDSISIHTLTTDYDIQLWTGLTDVNNIDIYEGDFLVDRYPGDETNEIVEELKQVVWCETQLTWCVDGSFAKDDSFLVPIKEYFGNDLEVKN